MPQETATIVDTVFRTDTVRVLADLTADTIALRPIVLERSGVDTWAVLGPLILTLGTLILSFFIWTASQRSATAAEDSAQAAKRSADATEEIAKLTKATQHLYELERDRNRAGRGRFVAELHWLQRALSAVISVMDQFDPGPAAGLRIPLIPDEVVGQIYEDLQKHEAALEGLIAEASPFPMEVMAHLQAALFMIRYQALSALEIELGLAGAPLRRRPTRAGFWDARNEVGRVRGLVDDAFQALPAEDRTWGDETGYAETFQKVWDNHITWAAIGDRKS